MSRRSVSADAAAWDGHLAVPRLTSAVILASWQHVETYYRHADLTPTSEADNIRLALRPLRELYGHRRAADFDALALEAVRSRMISDSLRNRVNRDLPRLKRMFKWAAGRKLVPRPFLSRWKPSRGCGQVGRKPVRPPPSSRSLKRRLTPRCHT